MYSDDQDIQHVDKTYKIVVLGLSYSGKTNLIMRAADDTYAMKHVGHKGNDIEKSFVHDINDYRYRLDVSEKARGIDGASVQPYTSAESYKGVDAVIVCLDLTDEEAIKETRPWIESAQRYAEVNTAIILVGTKNDYIGTRLDGSKYFNIHPPRSKPILDDKKLKTLVDELNLPYLAISAKKSENVAKVFDMAIRKINEKQGHYIKDEDADSEPVFRLPPQKKQRTCNQPFSLWKPPKEGISSPRQVFNSTGLAIGVGLVFGGIIGLATLNPVAATYAGAIAATVTMIVSSAIQLLLNNKVQRGAFFKIPTFSINLPKIDFHCPITFRKTQQPSP